LLPAAMSMMEEKLDNLIASVALLNDTKWALNGFLMNLSRPA